MTLSPKEFVENVNCLPVGESDALDILTNVIPDMIQLLVEQNGKGLAAPQVGIEKRFFIIRTDDTVMPYFNARYFKNGTARVVAQESCLTYGKENYTKVTRWKTIQAQYDTIVDNKFVHFMKNLRGYEAIAYQHEADHLDSRTIFNQ